MNDKRRNDMKKIGLIGAGSWGTALALTLSGKGHEVRVWDLDSSLLDEFEEHRENVRYLPGIKFGENLCVRRTVEDTVEGVDVVLFGVPAQHFRDALKGAAQYITDDMVVVNVAKGIERGSLKRMSEIADEVNPGMKYVVLSGPSHAEEVGRCMPTIVTVASENRELATYIQEVFSTDRFNIYTSDDVVGLELGGALKNIIALGAGISDGMGFGDNAKAALMTRGLVEMRRLGEKLGANPETFAGLAGQGDLIVTCTSMHSRNRRCGIMIGEGMDPQKATEKVGMAVEGMFSAAVAKELARKLDVKMPITESINDIIDGKITAKEAVDRLMNREMGTEID